MIRGIGVDLEQTDRFKRALNRRTFVRRVYTPGEQTHILGKVNSFETAAGIFCAKEALGKALGTGISFSLFQQAEVSWNSSGAPEFCFSGELAKKLENVHSFLSIAHSKGYAIAYVVLEENSYDSLE